MSKIFIVEDHLLIRSGYIALIKRTHDLEVCGQAVSAEDALLQIPLCAPNIVIVDVSLPGMSGVELVRQLKREQPHLPTLVISGHEESIFVQGVLAAGAQGYIMKDQAPQMLVEAIYTVLAGQKYVSEKMRARLLRNEEKQNEAKQ